MDAPSMRIERNTVVQNEKRGGVKRREEGRKIKKKYGER